MKLIIRYYLLLCCLPILIWSADSIKEYNIDIKILQTGEVEVSQEIIYLFDKKSDGIYFEIPYNISNGIKNIDIGIKDITLLRNGRIERFQTQEIDSKYIQVSTENEDKKLIGKQVYTIFYTISYGVSSYNKKFDKTNIYIRNHLEIEIPYISFHIKLPKSLSFENTLVKSLNDNKVKWINNRETIIKTESLKLNKDYSIDIIYPIHILYQSGKANSSISVKEQIFTTWTWFGIFLISIFSYKYWILLGLNNFKQTIFSKDKLPLDLDVLQSSLIYNRVTTNTIFTSAIIQLAHWGYIDITKYNKNTTPTLYKVAKDTKGLSYEMRYLLENILFSTELVINIQRDSNAQARKFLKGYNVINELLYAWSYREKYMQDNPKREKKLFLFKIFTISTPIIAMGIYSSIYLLGIDITAISTLHIVLFILSLLFINKTSMIFKFIAILLLSIISLFFIKEYYMPIGLYNMIYSPMILILFGYIAISYTYPKIGRYSEKGAIIKAQLDGLENFIKDATIHDIKSRLVHDKSYLDKYLPYAILFNQSDKWVSFYHKLGIDSPKWYMGSEIYTIKYFYEDMKNAIKIEQVTKKVPKRTKLNLKGNKI